MPRRVVTLLLVVALATVAGMARPGEAQALDPTPYESLRTSGTGSSWHTAFRALLDGRSGDAATRYGTLLSGETSTTRNGLRGMMWKARTGARFLPILTRVSIPLTAAYLTYRIVQNFTSGSDPNYDLWLDSDSLGKDALASGAGDPFGFSGCCMGFLNWHSAQWEQTPNSYCSVVGGPPCYHLELHTFLQSGGNSTDVDTVGGIPQPDHDNLTIDTVACAAAGFRVNGSDPCFGTKSAFFGTGEYWLGWIEWQTFGNMTQPTRLVGGVNPTLVTVPVTVGGSGGFGTATINTRRVVLPGDFLPEPELVDGSGSPTQTETYPVPTDAGATAGDTTAALDALDSICGRSLVNYLLDPATYPWPANCIASPPGAEPEPETFALPKPKVNETYADYLTRLADLGWIGAASLVELDPYDPEVGPEAVSRVGVTGQPGVWRRALWPVNNPRVGIGVDITIWHNPDSAPTAPSDPTDDSNPDSGIPGVPDAGSDCDPFLEADPNFSPLLDLDFGDRFPFGLFTWVASLLGAFLVAPEAPNWTFEVEIPATGVSPAYALPPFTIDLEWLDDYMATFRLLLTFVLWVGAIWYVGSGLLGLRTGGNPAEAVDEVL